MHFKIGFFWRLATFSTIFWKISGNVEKTVKKRITARTALCFDPLEKSRDWNFPLSAHFTVTHSVVAINSLPSVKLFLLWHFAVTVKTIHANLLKWHLHWIKISQSSTDHLTMWWIIKLIQLMWLERWYHWFHWIKI